MNYLFIMSHNIGLKATILIKYKLGDMIMKQLHFTMTFTSL